MENRDTPPMENRDAPSMGFCPLGCSEGTQGEDKEKMESPVGKVGNFHSGMEQPVSAGVSKEFLWEFLPGIPTWIGGTERMRREE